VELEAEQLRGGDIQTGVQAADLLDDEISDC
jgi:hypothetical protein